MPMNEDSSFSTKYFHDDQVAEMVNYLESGLTLTEVATRPRMPTVRTIIRWEAVQDQLGVTITRARDIGFAVMAEKARNDARTARDPALGRLVLDADKWFLAKMRPKIYGEAATLRHADADGEKIKLDEVSALTRLSALCVALVKRGSDDPDNA